MSDVAFSIRVVDEDGEGVAGVDVSVSYSTTHDSETTDSDGWVRFQYNSMMWHHASATVYIDGENVGDYDFDDGDTRSFTQP